MTARGAMVAGAFALAAGAVALAASCVPGEFVGVPACGSAASPCPGDAYWVTTLPGSWGVLATDSHLIAIGRGVAGFDGTNGAIESMIGSGWSAGAAVGDTVWIARTSSIDDPVAALVVLSPASLTEPLAKLPLPTPRGYFRLAACPAGDGALLLVDHDAPFMVDGKAAPLASGVAVVRLDADLHVRWLSDLPPLDPSLDWVSSVTCRGDETEELAPYVAGEYGEGAAGGVWFGRLDATAFTKVAVPAGSPWIIAGAEPVLYGYFQNGLRIGDATLRETDGGSFVGRLRTNGELAWMHVSDFGIETAIEAADGSIYVGGSGGPGQAIGGLHVQAPGGAFIARLGMRGEADGSGGSWIRTLACKYCAVTSLAPSAGGDELHLAGNFAVSSDIVTLDSVFGPVDVRGGVLRDDVAYGLTGTTFFAKIAASRRAPPIPPPQVDEAPALSAFAPPWVVSPGLDTRVCVPSGVVATSNEVWVATDRCNVQRYDAAGTGVGDVNCDTPTLARTSAGHVIVGCHHNGIPVANDRAWLVDYGLNGAVEWFASSDAAANQLDLARPIVGTLWALGQPSFAASLKLPDGNSLMSETGAIGLNLSGALVGTVDFERSSYPIFGAGTMGDGLVIWGQHQSGGSDWMIDGMPVTTEPGVFVLLHTTPTGTVSWIDKWPSVISGATAVTGAMSGTGGSSTFISATLTATAVSLPTMSGVVDIGTGQDFRIAFIAKALDTSALASAFEVRSTHGDLTIEDLAAIDEDRLLFCGTFSGEVSTSAGPLASGPHRAAFVAEARADGTIVRGERIPGAIDCNALTVEGKTGYAAGLADAAGTIDGHPVERMAYLFPFSID